MTENDKLADEIERLRVKLKLLTDYDSSVNEDEVDMLCNTALRAERPQSDEMVMVPREPTAEMIDAAWKLAAPESADYSAAPAFVAAMTKAYLAMLAATEAEKGKT